MAKRKVKLQDTGDYSTSDVSYKAPNGKYYSSKESYEKLLNEHKMRTKCVDKIVDLFGLKPGMKLPTLFYKRINELAIYGFEVVYNTIVNNESSITWALENKEFNSEVGKVQYVMAIIQNNINEEYKKYKADLKSKQKSDIMIEDVENSLDLVSNLVKNKAKDVSSLLGEDDLWN